MRKPKPIEAWDEKLAVLAAYKNADPALQWMNEHLAEQYNTVLKQNTRPLLDKIYSGDPKGFRKQYPAAVASIQKKSEAESKKRKQL